MCEKSLKVFWTTGSLISFKTGPYELVTPVLDYRTES